MEENGDKYMRKMDSFLKTMNTRVNRSTGKAPKKVTNKDFCPFFIFHRNSINQYKRQRFTVLKLVKSFVYQKETFRSKTVTNLSSQMKSSRLLKLLLINHQPITFAENKVIKF